MLRPPGLVTAASQLLFFCFVDFPLYNRHHILVHLLGCCLPGCCLPGFLVCDAAGWGLIDKTKYPISIAAGGLAPPKVSLDGAGTNPNGFAIAKSVAVEPTTELKVNVVLELLYGALLSLLPLTSLPPLLRQLTDGLIPPDCPLLTVYRRKCLRWRRG